MNLSTPSEFANHIVHCIQEEHGITLSKKVVHDIRNTVNGAYQAAARGADQKRKAADNRYYEQKYITEMLIDKVGGVLKNIGNN